MPKKIIFFGTPEFAVPSLKALTESSDFEVLAVVTQPDRRSGRKMKLTPSPIKVYATENNLPVITPQKITQDVIKELVGIGAESLVVIAFGQILPQSLLDQFPEKIVNIHGSLLPQLRGAAPIQRSIINGDKEGGVSLQVMKFKLDSGDILAERRVPITEEMTAIALHDILKEKSIDLLLNEYLKYLQGEVRPIPQDESQITFAPKLLKKDSLIYWSDTAVNIHNKIKGFLWGPGTYSYLNEKKIKFHKAKISQLSGDAGTVISVTKESFVVGCGQGALEFLIIQPESKPKMKVIDFLKGYPVKVGNQFKDSHE